MKRRGTVVDQLLTKLVATNVNVYLGYFCLFVESDVAYECKLSFGDATNICKIHRRVREKKDQYQLHELPLGHL